MSNNYYDILWVDKNASSEDIKKAYRKMAMKHHPDRNKWDDVKFKEVNNAYATLSDSSKRKQYDMFGSSGGNSFWWWTWGYSNAWFWGFEDIFWWMWGWFKWQSSWFDFNIEDLFWGMWWSGSRKTHTKKQESKEPETLDFEKTYEVPIFDLILGCKIEVKWLNWQIAKLKIPASTKPWAKFRVKDFGKVEWIKKWNLIVKVEALMPKNISDVDISLLERIRENVGY